ncbi:uncharacterized protein [Henckelia pumila]|uniref:uncharacterized protein n=1 Tax=Henckelia pumila TaxID=405737 RepID=UPI003C6DC32E
MSSCFPIPKTTFAQDVILAESPGSFDDPKRILIVVDALKEFQVDLLEWVLRNFTIKNRHTITILGIMPWLNMPLSSKTWSDMWSMNLENLSYFQEKGDFKNDPKCQKVQRLIDLCQKYGVEPEIRSEMGHPLRLLVIEHISNLHATLVVFDRHHDRKYIEYYAEKVPCNMVVVNDNGAVNLIKKRKSVDSDTEYSPAPGIESTPSIATCTKSVLSEQLKKCLKPISRGRHDKE